jgi:thioredoxin 1
MAELPGMDYENVDNILETEHMLVLDFGAEWCGPCKRIGPIVEKFANDHVDTVDAAYIDIGKYPMLAQRFGVMGVPTVIIIRGKKEAKRFGANLQLPMLEAELGK